MALSDERKGRYREIAREIIGKDREARKYGFSQNTIGAITSALERAYREGAADAAAPKPTGAKKGSLTWLQIPPTSRDLLIRMLRPGRGGDVKTLGLVRHTFTGKDFYTFVDANGAATHQGEITGKGVGPLKRLGLLEGDDILVLTEPAIRITMDYWARLEARDASLPRESLRP